MEGSQAAFRFDTCATKGIDGFKDAACQLVTGRGTGDNVLPNPIEVSDIFAVDGRERSGVFFHGVETLCPRIYSVYNCVIDLIEEHIDGGNVLVEIRETDCRQAAIGNLRRHIVHIDANATDRHYDPIRGR